MARGDFRSMVSMSSPLMESSFSTTAAELAPPTRASGTTASGLPIRGHSPKFAASEARVGPGDVAFADQRGQDPGDRPLAGPGRADQQQDLVQVGAAGQDVPEQLLQRVYGVLVVGP